MVLANPLRRLSHSGGEFGRGARARLHDPDPAFHLHVEAFTRFHPAVRTLDPVRFNRFDRWRSHAREDRRPQHKLLPSSCLAPFPLSACDVALGLRNPVELVRLIH
jgi:hypothetical protein